MNSNALPLPQGSKSDLNQGALNNLKRLNPRLGLLLSPLILGVVALTMGRYPISVDNLLAQLWPNSTATDSTIELILWQVRSPRIIAALLIGGALALAGSTYQGLFKNPMVSPDLLGASAGAGFGACMGLLLSLDYLSIQLLAFSCGLFAVGCCYLLSQLMSKGKNQSILLLVLTGMVVSTLFAAFISVTKYLADPYSKLPEITFWLMGSLSGVTPIDAQLLFIPMLLGAFPLLALRWRLDILSFGEEAQALGLATGQLRLLFIICATLLTSASVSLCGMIGWVGLLIPHLTRMLVGPSHRKLLPYSIAMGASFLLLVDTFARCVLPLELPLGILTALIGAPFFLYLLVHGRKGWL